MSKILVSGLVNIETNVRIRQFPINYYPIDYDFFGVKSSVGGVGYNLSKSLSILGDNVCLVSYLGNDFEAQHIEQELSKAEIDTKYILHQLKETPTSAILYDENGKRQIYCDLKDIQEKTYPSNEVNLSEFDLLAICNINFNRQLLKQARSMGKTIATDVHVLSNINDEYNLDFMECADILFLSHEGINGEPLEFLLSLATKYNNSIIVLSQGSKGVLMYVKDDHCVYQVDCVPNDNIVNTVGAGDSLFSSFLHFYAKGVSPIQSIKLAQTFASHKISFNGASVGFYTEEELMQDFNSKSINHTVIPLQ